MIFPIQFSYVITIVALLILLYCTYSGYKDGFVMKGCELLSMIICIIIAWVLSGQFNTTLQWFPKDYSLFTQTILDSPIYLIMNRFFLFLILFVISRILIILIRPIFRSINWVPLVGKVNKLLGIILGFVQGFALIVVFAFILSSPLFANGSEVLEASKLSAAKDVYRTVMFMFDDSFSKMESVQKIVTPSQALLEEDIDNIQTWLAAHGFNAVEQQEVMDLINQRNGI